MHIHALHNALFGIVFSSIYSFSSKLTHLSTVHRSFQSVSLSLSLSLIICLLRVLEAFASPIDRSMYIKQISLHQGLGVWQYRRMKWKEGLIEERKRQLNLAPIPIEDAEKEWLGTAICVDWLPHCRSPSS